MSFILGQYNKKFDDKIISAESIPNTTFMSLVKNGNAWRRKKVYNNDIFNDSGLEFWDECVRGLSLIAGISYFFHCKIRKNKTSQRFDIKLVNYDDNSKEQYIKTIDIVGGDESEWVNVEFIFTPAADFNTILFELTRTTTDYQEGVRYPVFIYQELSIINNIINAEIAQDISLAKIGVQSHPGLLMCINGEPIRIGKTGIYELKNGIISVSKFSVISAAVDSKENMDKALKNIEDQKENIVNKNDFSQCIFGAEGKSRSIDAFTLDYMYERRD